MNKLFFSLSLFLLVWFMGCNNDQSSDDDNPIPQDYEIAVELGDSSIPYILITTDQAIRNEPKIEALMQIYQGGELVQIANIGIEYRGSTSFRISDKKSFGIETWDAGGNDVDQSFFGFPEEEDWILQGHVVNLGNNFIIDRTLMYHKYGYDLYRSMGRYGSRTQFVELQINHEYLGVYVFMEKLKRDQERINITSLTPADNSGPNVTGGYILKIDKTAGGGHNQNQPLEYFLTNWEDDARYTQENSFRSAYDINGGHVSFPPYDAPYHINQYLETYFLYEYPKPDAITTEQKSYIQDYMHQFETALLNDDFNSDIRTYTNFIDLESFVDFFLINEICRNVDGYRISTYLHKDRNGKLAMGPIWDLNIGYDTGDRVPWDGWVYNYNQYVERDAWMVPFWWPRLMQDPIFRSAIKQRWTELRPNVLSNESLLSKVDENADYLTLNGATSRNYTRWNMGIDYEQSVNELKGFLTFRANWMNAEIENFN